ncbi:MAG TPA: biotin synthase BioB [Candidatus Brocadiia bacterium]|nr:biotin synthase BioB [Candidatus Brocadiia bacterium]
MNAHIARAGRAAESGKGISRQTALDLLQGEGDLPDIMYWADRTRRAFHGDKVVFCAILSARQGRCSEDCRFCAQSAHYPTATAAHPLMDLDAMTRAAQAPHVAHCARFGLVTSGLGPKEGPEWERLLEAERRIAKSGRCHACAAFGKLTEKAARELVEAGVTRYNHNLETSRRFYPSVCTTHTYDDRIETVRIAKAAGLAVCCGGIFGMGETAEDRVDMAMDLRALNVDSIPINFLNPIPGTPFAGLPPLKPLECLRIVAVFRLMFPDKDIKLAGGRELRLRDLQSWMFYAGANSAILGNYLTTAGRRAEDDVRMVRDLSLRCVSGAEALSP